ncbi:MAG: GAP family protein [Anaerolineales bacterium]|nr:GAP family protein [Anaerolineales bacterium]
MAYVWLELLPVLLGAAAVPVYPILVLLLLQSKGGLGKALAFVGGVVTMRLAQGLVFGSVFATAGDNPERSGVVVAVLLLMLGIFLLTTAVRKWRKVEDPDAPPPAWMSGISQLTPLKAFGLGALFVTIAVKQWVFTLSALSIIHNAYLSQTASVSTYLLYTAATQLLGVIPIIVFAIAPTQSAKPLQAALSWLERNNNTIVMLVSFIFGLWFTYKGVMGLLG